jgi:hypothetical protein
MQPTDFPEIALMGISTTSISVEASEHASAGVLTTDHGHPAPISS